MPSEHKKLVKLENLIVIVVANNGLMMEKNNFYLQSLLGGSHQQ